MTSVSTIIPVYNASGTIKRCLDSLLDAQVPDVLNEIIIVNDGSTDNTLNICKQYERNHPNIKLFTQENKGPSSARNKGLANAYGEFITFVDSDDYVTSDYYSLINCNVIDKPDIVMFGYYKQKYSVIEKHTLKKQSLKKEDIIQLIRNSSNKMNYFWFPWMKVYRHEVIKNIKFDSKVKIGEDTLFNLEVFVNSTNMKIMDDVFYYYVETPNSLTQSRYKNYLLENMIAHYEKRVEIYNKYPKIQGDVFMKDIAKYYINHILFWLLSNVKDLDKIKKRDEIIKIRDSKIYDKCFKYYTYNWVELKKSIIVKLFELRLYTLMSNL